MSERAFVDPENLAVFTTWPILEGKEPILLVCHDADDNAWQFLPGRSADMNEAAVVSLKEIVELDPSVQQVADLPLGWRAVRSQIGGDWSRAPSP